MYRRNSIDKNIFSTAFIDVAYSNFQFQHLKYSMQKQNQFHFPPLGWKKRKVTLSYLQKIVDKEELLASLEISFYEDLLMS